MTPTPSSAHRLFFLDWLRILALAGLIIYHVGMYYVSWDFHVKSPFAGPGLEPWMKLSEPWRMSLLFMVSGAATATMLKSGTSFIFIRRRSARLLLPLLFGVVLIVPPQSYFEVVQKWSYTGDYFDFLRLYFSGNRSFCRHSDCLVLPTWNHLWFLPYLWSYSLLTCGVLALWPLALLKLCRCFEVAFRGVGLMVLPVVFLLVTRLALFAHFPSTHALLDDWFNHATYLFTFVVGGVFAVSHQFWARLAAIRWFALVMAIAFWTVLVFVRPAKPLEHLVIATYQWSALVAAFGFAKTHLNCDSPLRHRLTEAVFPVYILHQTILIMASQALLPFQLLTVVEGPLLILITFALSFAGHVWAARFKFLRPWLGLKQVRTSQPEHPLQGHNPRPS